MSPYSQSSSLTAPTIWRMLITHVVNEARLDHYTPSSACVTVYVCVDVKGSVPRPEQNMLADVKISLNA